MGPPTQNMGPRIHNHLKTDEAPPTHNMGPGHLL